MTDQVVDFRLSVRKLPLQVVGSRHDAGDPLVVHDGTTAIRSAFWRAIQYVDAGARRSFALSARERHQAYP